MHRVHRQERSRLARSLRRPRRWRVHSLTMPLRAALQREHRSLSSLPGVQGGRGDWLTGTRTGLGSLSRKSTKHRGGMAL